MDAIVKGLFGAKPAQKPVVDTDFADFAAAPDPSPVSIPASPADASAAKPTRGPRVGKAPIPYTKWYRVWERTGPEDFYMEMFLIPLILLAVLVHFWGASTNKRKARKWAAVHYPVLDSEFAMVGYHRTPKAEGTVSPQDPALLENSNKMGVESLPDDVLKETTAWEYQTYASGRQNVAFLDLKVILKRRMNPLLGLAEEITGMFIESVKPKAERMEAVLYTFDGNEKQFVPPPVPGAEEMEKLKAIANSAHDGFVFAVVNKMHMRKLRDERYDVSLTFTKDNAKLPDWATVMSESAEVTDTMLTKDLLAAIESAGDYFEYLIISDQPTDKPTTLDEAKPKKRIHMSLRLPSDGNFGSTLPIFQTFLRLPDMLVASAHFRPEVMKKINATRETEKAKLKKVSDKEAEEERLKQLDKLKKEEKDRKMKGMSAEEQRKYLEREAEKSRKKQEKKMSRRG